MTDTTVEQPPAETAPDAPKPEGQQPKPQPPEVDWKARAREWEKRAKENGDAAKRLADLEEAQKTEQQKAQERAEAAERQAVQAQRELTRYRIAAEVGVPADLLAGDDEDSIRAHAERLKAFRGQPAAPRPDPTQGARPGDHRTRAADGVAEAQKRFGKSAGQL